MASLDDRYREKVRARSEGRVPVFTHDPALDTTSKTPEAIEARYRAKLARHGKPEPKVEPAKASAQTPVQPAPAEDKPKGETQLDKPDQKQGGKPEPKADDRREERRR